MTSPLAEHKRAAIFVNKHSGRVSSTDLHELREAAQGPFRALGVETEFYVEDCPSLMQAVRECHPDTDLYVVIGGDGTIAAMAEEITRFDRDEKPVFVPLPFGTANMFTRDLGLPLDPWEALEAAVRAPAKPVDVATVNGRAFLNNVVLGTFAEVAVARENFRAADNLHDKTVSLFETADALFHSGEHRYLVRMDNREEDISTNTIIVSNNAFNGALEGVPHRDRLDSGELAVYLTDSHDGFGFLARVAEAVLGNLEESDAVAQHNCRRCIIAPRDGEKVHYTVDGEYLTSDGPLVFQIQHKALKVPVPVPDAAG